MSGPRGYQSEPPARSAREVLDGKYELLRCLGKGGMGEVWEAEHIKLGRRVAIKFIHAAAAQDAGTLQRFQNEARASAKLQSRFIVQVIDDGVAADARPYIVMEKLVGESLGDRLDRVGKLEPEAVRLVLRDVCRGLAVAHDAGIVHRDLKPDNIFLHRGPDDDAETAKLVDFGIAKIAEGAIGPGHSTTQTGSLLGTPLYMSPEQARGAKPIDARSDTWSLGVVVYQSLTGDVPFRGSTVGDIAIHICMSDHDLPSARNPRLPLTLDNWMARALAKDKQHRFATAADLFSWFERALAGEEIEPPPADSRRQLKMPVTGDSDTLDIAAPTPARRPLAPLPEVRAATTGDEKPAPSVTTAPEERAPTLSAVATRGSSPPRRGTSRGLMIGVGLLVLGAIGATVVALTTSHGAEPSPSSTGLVAHTSPQPQASQPAATASPSSTLPLPAGNTASSAPQLASGASPAPPGPAGAAASASAHPGATAAGALKPGAAHTAGPGKRKGPAGDGDDLGY